MTRPNAKLEREILDTIDGLNQGNQSQYAEGWRYIKLWLSEGDRQVDATERMQRMALLLRGLHHVTWGGEVPRRQGQGRAELMPELIPIGGQMNLMGQMFEVIAHRPNSAGAMVEVPGKHLGPASGKAKPMPPIIKPDGSTEVRIFTAHKPPDVTQPLPVMQTMPPMRPKKTKRPGIPPPAWRGCIISWKPPIPALRRHASPLPRRPGFRG